MPADDPDLSLTEQKLRIAQMELNIEKMRADMRLDQRKFTIQIVATIAAALSVGVALGSFLMGFGHH